MLARPELEQLAQRVIARYHLDALTRSRDRSSTCGTGWRSAGLQRARCRSTARALRAHPRGQRRRAAPHQPAVRPRAAGRLSPAGRRWSTRRDRGPGRAPRCSASPRRQRPAPGHASRAGGRAGLVAGRRPAGGGALVGRDAATGRGAGRNAAPAAAVPPAPAAVASAAVEPVVAAAGGACRIERRDRPRCCATRTPGLARTGAGLEAATPGEGDPCAALAREQVHCFSKTLQPGADPPAGSAGHRHAGRSTRGQPSYAMLTALTDQTRHPARPAAPSRP